VGNLLVRQVAPERADRGGLESVPPTLGSHRGAPDVTTNRGEKRQGKDKVGTPFGGSLGRKTCCPFRFFHWTFFKTMSLEAEGSEEKKINY